MTTAVEQHPKLTLQQIQQEALMLPLEEREALTLAIVESVEAERADIDRSWLEEVQRRIARFERGESVLIDHDEVMRLVEQDLADEETGPQ